MRTLFEIGKSGLRTAERSLSVTSNNITNANTPGYSRQRVETKPVGMQKTPFHAGLGVNITEVSRMRNEMNDILLNQKRQDMGYLKEQARVYQQLQTTMSTDTGNDIDMRVSRLFDAFAQLSADPQDLSVRNNLISEATQLTLKLSDINQTLERTSELTRDSAITTVNQINKLVQKINNLNKTITQASGQGKPHHASMDERVQTLEKLAELVDFDVTMGDNDAVMLDIGGIKVLDENRAIPFKPEIDDTTKTFRLRLENGKTIESFSGKLGAEIEMYQKGVPEMKEKLDFLSAKLVEEFNNIHSQGYGLEDDTFRNFFDPDFTTAADIRVNGALINNHKHIAASGEAFEAGNSDLAVQMAGLRDQPVMDGRKFVDYSVNLVSLPGTKLSDLNSQIEARDSEIQMLSNLQEQEAGVNIDEELSLMIQYQNAYQGAARVMSAAQEMYDTLIGLMR
jgi:flagellar hook-associated protein 1